MVSREDIIKSIPNLLKSTDFDFGKKHTGKVRDTYILPDKRIIITTDRQSAFDKILGHIPFKGAVLNQLASFWFEKTSDIIGNHMISVPDPNVSIVENCELVPIEMVVRGYITGVTDTSIWGSYEKGERLIYGIKFPDGLKKNQKLPEPVITPTTKAESGHDERLTEDKILERRVVSKEIWEQMKNAALEVFKRGTEICDEAGIILADTKYEFGIRNGKLVLIDEVHTPDSSRFWLKSSYDKKLERGQEPESYDKEPLRIWFKEQGYTGDGEAPVMPDEFLVKMSELYQGIYEKITGKTFEPFEYPIEERIKANIQKSL